MRFSYRFARMEMRCIRHSISRGRNLPLENRERIRGMIRWHMRCRRRISGACSFMRGSIRTVSRGYLNRYSDLCASNPAIAWAKDGDSSNDRWVLCQNGEYYYNPAIPQVRQLIIDGVKEIVTNYEVDGIHFDDYFYPNLDDSKAGNMV